MQGSFSSQELTLYNFNQEPQPLITSIMDELDQDRTLHDLLTHHLRSTQSSNHFFGFESAPMPLDYLPSFDFVETKPFHANLNTIIHANSFENYFNGGLIQQEQSAIKFQTTNPILDGFAHRPPDDVDSRNNGGGRLIIGGKKKNAIMVKGQWTIEEDRALIQLVERYGFKKWSDKAQMLNGRTGKQCRERWHNHLRPDIKKETWSEEEDKILITAHAEIGNKWAKIAKRLPGRTENSIKNHWNAAKRRHFCRCRKPLSSFDHRHSLLQDYIKGLDLCVINASCSKKSITVHRSPTPPPAGSDYYSMPEFSFEAADLFEEEVESNNNIDSLFQISSTPNHTDCLMLQDDDGVGEAKKELDLVEMIIQANL